MQCPAHILYELNRTVRAGCVGNGKLETTFIGRGAHSRVVIRLRRDQRCKVHLTHRRKIQLKRTGVANRFFKFRGNRFTNRQNDRIRSPGRGATGRCGVPFVSITGVSWNKSRNTTGSGCHAEARVREAHSCQEKISARRECKQMLCVQWLIPSVFVETSPMGRYRHIMKKPSVKIISIC